MEDRMRYALQAALTALALALLAGVAVHTPGTRAAESPGLTEHRGLPGRPPPRPAPTGPPAPAPAVAKLNALAGGRQVEWLQRSRAERVAVRDGVSMDQALAAYRASPLVAEASVTRVATIRGTPNDPKFPYQWHLRSTDAGIWADTAWDLATNRGQGVLVAVIDTGGASEDYNGTLEGRPQSFKQAPDLASTAFMAPWDFANNDAHPNDDHGHGTHVTGTITQDTGNGYGMAGVADNASIMPLKAMDYAGNGVDADIVEAIYYAVDNGADVINMSLGWPDTGLPDANGDVCTEIAGLNAALDYAYAHGVVVVAAAGNDGGPGLWPAGSPTGVAVGAPRVGTQVTFYSNRGSALDMTAPGGDPYVDQNGDGYPDGVLQQTLCYDPTLMLWFNLYGTFCDVYNEGTSMASPPVG